MGAMWLISGFAGMVALRNACAGLDMGRAVCRDIWPCLPAYGAPVFPAVRDDGMAAGTASTLGCCCYRPMLLARKVVDMRYLVGDGSRSRMSGCRRARKLLRLGYEHRWRFWLAAHTSERLFGFNA
jgi:hypothetical protein